jgi:hypothetical protein
MTKLTSESPIGDIIARFKELSGSTSDDKTIAKRGRAKLLARIEELEAAIQEQPDVELKTIGAEGEQAVEEFQAEGPSSLDAEVAEEIASGQHDGSGLEQPADEQKSLNAQLAADIEPPSTKKAKKAKREKKPKKEKKPKGPVIRAEAEKLLLKVVSREENRAYGMPYEAILGELAKTFPDAKTTVACLRWYAVHMRERGEKVPARPRATKQAEAA